MDSQTVRGIRLLALFSLAVTPVAVGQEILTAWGDPNLEGLWDYRTLTPLERPPAFADKAEFTPEEAEQFRDGMIQMRDVDNRPDDANVDIESAYNTAWYDWGTRLGDLRTSLIVSPANGRLPELTPAARTQMRERYTQDDTPSRDMVLLDANVAGFSPGGPEAMGLSERCLVGFNAVPHLIPSAYNNNLRIVQTPGHVLLVTEMIHNARIVPLDDRPYLPDQIPQWNGVARAYWDENTLVVQSRNFTDKLPVYQLPFDLADLDKNGAVGFGSDLQLTERFTRIDTGTLRYEYTVEDPNTFVEPLKVQFDLRASTEKMYEYACHEGNYGMMGVLRGARVSERESQLAGQGE